MAIPAIDVVYTWVNGSDPAWQLQKALYSQQQQQQRQQEAAHTTDHISGLNDEPISAAEANETALEIAATAASRYRSSDELLYSIRSLFRFAPWVRHVYVVTAGQVPSWMVDYHPQLTVVPHSALYPNQSHLPTFSSSSIEVHLHRLEGCRSTGSISMTTCCWAAPSSPATSIRLARAIRCTSPIPSALQQRLCGPSAGRWQVPQEVQRIRLPVRRRRLPLRAERRREWTHGWQQRHS